MILKKLNPGDNMQLRFTLNDSRAVAYPGQYYAQKIRGGDQPGYVQRFKR